MDAELLPAARQSLWGRLAAANFFLGGAGAGTYVVAAALSGFKFSPLLSGASVLGPGLILAGFLCVAAEAGRPPRGLFVLRKIGTSWMSRELWAGGAFVLAAATDLVRPHLGWRIAGTLAALLLVLAQGAILSRAKGVGAWNVPLMPSLFLVSALASGAGVLALALPLLGVAGVGELPRVMAGLVVLSALVWAGYLAWPGDVAFRRATASFMVPSMVVGVFVAGHVIPLALLGLAIEARVSLWSALAGVLVLLGQLQAKAWLILRAGELRPITIPSLRLRRSREQAWGEG